MTAQVDMQALRQMIRQLSPIVREELAEWILNSPDIEVRVEEPPPPYGGHPALTVDEFLRLEEDTSTRCEYIAGQIFPILTTVVRHQMIVTNVFFRFFSQMRGGPCVALQSNTRVRLQANGADIVYIPDVVIACGPFADEVLNQRYLTDPCVVVEVASAFTEAIDRREKPLTYRQIPSLEEYLVVSQRTMEVTIFRRSENWSPTVLTKPEDVYESRAVEVNIALADIYEGTR
jgi:Uma2 family endonuclease